MPKLSSLTVPLGAGILSAGLVHGSAQAATIAVTTGVTSYRGDVPGCSLHEAIVSSNNVTNQNNGCSTGSGSGTDTITFSNSLASPNNTITLARALSVSKKDIEIDGSSVAGGIVLRGPGQRPLRISNSKVTLNRLTITEGGEAGYEGGGITILDRYNSLVDSDVTLNNCVITNNYTTDDSGGGGVLIGRNATLTLNNTIISNNRSADGGGGIQASDNARVILNNSSIVGNNTFFYTEGGFGGGVNLSDNATFTAVNSTISGNVSARGGGINHDGQLLNLTNVTLSRNTATLNGGALRLATDAKSLNLLNSTISNNVSPRATGVFVIGRSAVVNIVSSTISNNSIVGSGDGGDGSNTAGVVALNGSVDISNSIIANSVRGGDCFRRDISDISIDSNSIVEDGSCGAARAGDPGLLALAPNGGRTQTLGLKENSIAVDSGNASICPSRDQRGKRRDARCDVGSFELMESDLEQRRRNREDVFFTIPTKNGKTVTIPL